ncbi:MAG: COG4315 family predicted lipoprotein [Methanocrinis sp.]
MRFVTLLALALLATAVAAYASDEQAAEIEYTVQLASDEALGTFLVDGEGMTLYRFASDVPGSGASACYGGCAELWPVFFAEEIAVPAELDVTDFNGIEREDGSIQTTYRGWPLYYYVEDEAPGDFKGQNAGGVWFVVSPDDLPSE